MQIHKDLALAYFWWSDQQILSDDLPDQVDIFDFKQKARQHGFAINANEAFDQLLRREQQFQEQNIHVITPSHENYPHKIGLCTETKPIFCVQGVWPKKEKKFLTVVGCRRPSYESLRWMRYEMPEALKIKDLIVVSGAARGIDQEAHDLAIATDVPTLAFLPCGIDHVYPESFLRIKQQVLDQGGGLVSGFAPWDKMRKAFFHQRNRWMIALANFTFVVESHRGGGTWLSAQLALEHSVPIGTIPVHPLSSWGLGNNDLLHCSNTYLIRDGKDLNFLLSSSS